MAHDYARRCPICNKFYVRKGRRGRCLGPERHEFDIYTTRESRLQHRNRRRE